MLCNPKADKLGRAEAKTKQQAAWNINEVKRFSNRKVKMWSFHCCLRVLQQNVFVFETVDCSPQLFIFLKGFGFKGIFWQKWNMIIRIIINSYQNCVFMSE